MASTLRNFKSENHTRINKLASVALNPKFAQSVAQAFANFGFATLAPYLANPHGAG